jgi:hypothetical protein
VRLANSRSEKDSTNLICQSRIGCAPGGLVRIGWAMEALARLCYGSSSRSHP